MAENAAVDERLTCERCRAYVAIELEEGPRLRCTLCGFSKELTEDEARRGLEADAAAGARPPSEPVVRKVSAASLLDFTPSPIGPKLLLTSDDTNPNIGDLVAAAKAELEAPAATAEPPKREEPKPEEPKPEDGEEPIEPPKSSTESLDEDDIEEVVASAPEERVEPAPISLESTALVEDDEPPQSNEEHEPLSLKDLVVVPELVPDSTPPPPVRGELRTLPPTQSRTGLAAAPPPTITFDESEEKAAAAAPARERVSSVPPPPKKEKRRADERRRDTTPPAAKKDDEAPKRSWVVPALAASAALLVVWKLMGGSPPRPDPAPPATTAAAAPPGPTPTASELAPEPVQEPKATVSSTPPASNPPSPAASKPAEPKAPEVKAAADKPSDTKPIDATGAKVAEPKAAEAKPAPAADGLSMSDLLDRAGSAKRSGDLTAARDYYDRVLKQNPGNVEANGGLGDVARAQGDLAAAKASYERALAASPSYGPAQLGLADTEWDLGNRAAAQRRYAQIVERLGDRAPQRAKERGTVE